MTPGAEGRSKAMKEEIISPQGPSPDDVDKWVAYLRSIRWKKILAASLIGFLALIGFMLLVAVLA